jgi:hypothetical protein
MDTQPPALLDPVAIIVTPTRVGRHHDFEPFRVGIGSHRPGTTADRLAGRILKHVEDHLLSDSYVVSVNLKKKTWTIAGGRFGGGTFEFEEDAR